MLSDISKKMVALPLPLSLQATGSMLMASATKFCFNDAVVIERAFAAEITLFALETIGKRVGIVDDEVLTVKQVENKRCRGDSQQSGFAIPLAVKMLIPGVQRDREQASCLPFKTLLLPAGLPNRRSAAPVEHVK